jgi:hypothetical protein
VQPHPRGASCVRSGGSWEGRREGGREGGTYMWEVGNIELGVFVFLRGRACYRHLVKEGEKRGRGGGRARWV